MLDREGTGRKGQDPENKRKATRKRGGMRKCERMKGDAARVFQLAGPPDVVKEDGGQGEEGDHGWASGGLYHESFSWGFQDGTRKGNQRGSYRARHLTGWKGGGVEGWMAACPWN